MNRRATALLIVALAAAGCSSSGSGAGSGPAHSTPPPASAAAPAGKEWPKPNVGNAAFAMGVHVLITPKGFEPKQLLAPMGYPVVWKNVSDTVQSVHLDNFGAAVDSGPIQPGATWSFNPNAQLSIIYHSAYGAHFHGQLQVQAVGNY